MDSVPAQQNVSSSGCGVNSRMVLPRISSRRTGRSWARSGYNGAARRIAAVKYCLSIIVCIPVLHAAIGLRAGVSRIDITPPTGHAMGGYSERKGGATGTHDPLYATVLVLESGSERTALVTCDLRSFVATRVADLAKQRYGITHTIVSSSHTHSGPLTWEAPSPWYRETENAIVAAIGEAVQGLVEASIGGSTGSGDLGVNPRQGEDGRAPTWLSNAGTRPSPPLGA